MSKKRYVRRRPDPKKEWALALARKRLMDAVRRDLEKSGHLQLLDRALSEAADEPGVSSAERVRRELYGKDSTRRGA